MKNIYELEKENIDLKEEIIKKTEQLVFELEDSIKILREKQILFDKLEKCNNLNLKLIDDLSTAITALQKISYFDSPLSEIAKSALEELSLHIKKDTQNE